VTGKIVLVEDNKPIREMVTYILKEAGHDVVVAKDGHEGLDAIKNEHPDLVLLDLDLPGADGFQVLDGVRAEPNIERTPLVAFTAFAMVGERQRVLAAGFDGYIAKPIDPEGFINEIERYLPHAS
jgi:CheY-like chemotaxis protein